MNQWAQPLSCPVTPTSENGLRRPEAASGGSDGGSAVFGKRRSDRELPEDSLGWPTRLVRRGGRGASARAASPSPPDHARGRSPPEDVATSGHSFLCGSVRQQVANAVV